jgi:hypothetical protein
MKCGIYGKLPSKRDFVVHNMPRPFLNMWENWLQSAVAASHNQLGDSWHEAFLSALEEHGDEIVFQFSLGAEPLPFETVSRLSQATIAQLAEMIARHPKLRFQCFLSSRHANQSLCTLARELPNLSLAGYWWHNFFPDVIRQVIAERLDMLPLNGGHTAMPLGKFKIAEFAKEKEASERDFVMVVGETFREECGEARQMVYFVDATIESKPMVVSHWTVPEASGNFCTRGGRFGSHSSNERADPHFDQKLTFITYFNAGVRVLDIRNPYEPKEVGYFIPPISRATGGRSPRRWPTGSRLRKMSLRLQLVVWRLSGLVPRLWQPVLRLWRLA